MEAHRQITDCCIRPTVGSGGADASEAISDWPSMTGFILDMENIHELRGAKVEVHEPNPAG
jgi:hypothetical protein